MNGATDASAAAFDYWLRTNIIGEPSARERTWMQRAWQGCWERMTPIEGDDPDLDDADQCAEESTPVMTPTVQNHPGIYVRRYMEAQRLRRSNLAGALGIERRRMNKILNCDGGAGNVDAVLALQLARVFPGRDARFWLELQLEYDLSKALAGDRS